MQKIKRAMDTVRAPSYTKLIMAPFQEKHIHPYIKEMPFLHLRYIDDIFIIWKETKE